MGAYFNGEMLEAKCERCGEAFAFMHKQLSAIPSVLALHLKRFIPNMAKARYDKQHEAVDIPLELDVFACLGLPTPADSNANARLPARPLASEHNADASGADAISKATTCPQRKATYALRAVVAHDGNSPQ